LGYTHFYRKTSAITKTVLTSVFASVYKLYIDIIADTNHSLAPSLVLLLELYQKRFQIHKAKIELLTFNSELLLHLSYNKNGIKSQTAYHLSQSAAKFCAQRSFPPLL